MGNNNNKFNDEEEKLKRSYYETMARTLKDRYDKNRYDAFNQNYSLLSKDFERCYVNQRVTITTKNTNFIPWKSYLIRGLRAYGEKNGYIWVKPLYKFVSSSSFPEQTKYQNMFFYQEIQILLKPKIKHESNINNYEKENKENSDNNIIINNKEEKIDTSDPLYNIKQRISSNLMGSFISGESESINSSMRRDPNYEYQYNKTKIKEYMDIFKQHICIKEHPLHEIIINFIKNFSFEIDEVIDFYKNNHISKKEVCNERANDIIKQLQDFIVLMQNVIKLFYSRSISYFYFRDEKDEFLNLVSYIIFNSEKIYHKFFALFELMNLEKTKLFNDKLELLGDLEPQDIGVKDKFCLNEKTKKFMEKLKSEKKDTKIHTKIYKNKSNIVNTNIAFKVKGEEKLLDIKEDEDVSSSLNKIENESDIINTSKPKSELKESYYDGLKVTSDSGRLNFFTYNFSLISSNTKVPYGQAIEFIRKISDFKVPLEKLVVIASISSLITECVNVYWKIWKDLYNPLCLV